MAERTNTIIPNPDPSNVTNNAIDRRVANLEAVLNAKIEGMEKAVGVFQSDLTRVPTQLDRGITSLRDLIEARLMSFDRGHRELQDLLTSSIESSMLIINTRLGGMDKAIELLQSATNQAPEFVRDQVGQLRDLHGERFSSIDAGLVERDKRIAQSLESIDTQFQERDKRTEQLSLSDGKAIAAALQAQKESAGATQETSSVALAKMESNFTKLIEQGSALVQSVSKNLDDKIADLKGRLDRGEGKTSVSDPAMTEAIKVMSINMASLATSRDSHAGADKSATDSTSRMMAIIAVAVALFVGVGEIIVRLAH